MDFLEFLKVLVLGIVEGLTEWLPISSTGHMLLLDEIFPLALREEFKEMFFVVIQLGAILAVVSVFFKRMIPFELNNGLKLKKDTFSKFSRHPQGYHVAKNIFLNPALFLILVHITLLIFLSSLYQD